MGDESGEADDMTDDLETGLREWLSSPAAEEQLQEVAQELIVALAPHLDRWVGGLDLLRRGRNAARAWVAEHAGEIEAFAAQLEEWPSTLERMPRRWADACVEASWPPSPQFPFWMVREITEAREAGLPSEEVTSLIDEAAARWFTDDRLSDLVAAWFDWPEVMAPRRPLIEEALRAHRDGQYGLSTLVFLSQVEGILVSAFQHVGWLSGHGVKTKKKAPQPSYLERLLTPADEASDDFKLGPAARYFTEALFGKFMHGQPVQGLNRHAILHGADLSYATWARSTQALLALDLVVSSLGWVGTQSGLVHRAGCPELRDVEPDHLVSVFRRLGGWMPEGLQPCERCMSRTRLQEDPAE